MPDNKKKEGLTVLLFLVLLVLFINISKNLSLSFSKAGAKVKHLFQTTKLFLKFFFKSLSAALFAGSLCEREKNTREKENKRRTGRNLLRFINMSSGKARLSWKAGAKVGTLPVQSKFKDCFFSLFFWRERVKRWGLARWRGTFFYGREGKGKRGKRGHIIILGGRKGGRGRTGGKVRGKAGIRKKKTGTLHAALHKKTAGMHGKKRTEGRTGSALKWQPIQELQRDRWTYSG